MPYMAHMKATNKLPAPRGSITVNLTSLFAVEFGSEGNHLKLGNMTSFKNLKYIEGESITIIEESAKKKCGAKTGNMKEVPI